MNGILYCDIIKRNFLRTSASEAVQYCFSGFEKGAKITVLIKSVFV